MSKGLIPSAVKILKDAEKINPESDINELHSKTFELMKKHRAIYYKGSGT